MPLDRYTKAVLTIIALALSVIALNPWIAPGRWLRALAPDAAAAQRRKETTVPTAWGKLVGFSDGYGLFEATDGTLRQVGLQGGSLTGVTKRR
ncbi:MAG TPA: hypothetical protein VGW35_09140 [Methylomirabilota bacterium]|jgi:hypothetical protein|nr:hypothetical protein [Methylomirabilota bacterium]